MSSSDEAVEDEEEDAELDNARDRVWDVSVLAS
jgi:hypothetical protein